MTEVLGYSIYDNTKAMLLNTIMDTPHKLHIVSGNPEVLHTGLSNKELFDNFSDANSIIIPDGAGVVIASRLIGQPVREKIAGIEVMEAVLSCCEKEGKAVYLLGAQQDVLEQCINNLSSKYARLKIAGFHNGFFNLSDCGEIIKDINNKKPFAVFVAMGCPRQELFITKYMNSIDASVFMGVGGSFDVLAGRVQRAPRWMIRLNLEWLYRVSKEPWRIKRLGSIPKFLYKAVIRRGV
jgi:N-acetylglucosaminyldiphosphoundecaprenol N-acetyl-beta-D-mannosaminyltransferase